MNLQQSTSSQREWGIRRLLLPLLVCLLAMVPGQSRAQDYTAEDVARLREFACQGDAEAQFYLGNCYYYGEVVKQDYSEAVKWYRQAAQQGLAEAQYNLGNCYCFGEGVTQNHTEAVKWYRKAAEQGLASAQCNLGVCYDKGEGVAQNYTEAVKWYRKAAEQGHAGAQYCLGHNYCYGEGVTQSYAEAAKWYRKAAAQGHAKAKENLELVSFFACSSGETYSLFFPVYGVLPGKTTVADVKAWGYNVDKGYSKSYTTRINSIAFWDHDGDRVFKDIYMTEADGGMPAEWEELGFDWRLSYDEWVALLEEMGFTIEHVKKPTTVEYSGRKTLQAEFVATAPDQTFSMDLSFNYGNENGEGSSTRSRASLSSILVKLLQCPSTFPPSKPWYVSVSSIPTISRGFSDFFPVYNITLGQTTTSAVKSLGYAVEDNKHASVNALTFWDHNEDGIFEHLYFVNSDMMPEKWTQLGLNWRLSYNDWLTLFHKMGFTIEHLSLPKVQIRAFYARFTATAPDQSFEMELDFNYGNGHTANSKGTLYSITVRKR